MCHIGFLKKRGTGPSWSKHFIGGRVGVTPLLFPTKRVERGETSLSGASRLRATVYRSTVGASCSCVIMRVVVCLSGASRKGATVYRSTGGASCYYVIVRVVIYLSGASRKWATVYIMLYAS